MQEDHEINGEKNSACIKNKQQYTIEIHTSQRHINYSKVVEKQNVLFSLFSRYTVSPSCTLPVREAGLLE